MELNNISDVTSGLDIELLNMDAFRGEMKKELRIIFSAVLIGGLDTKDEYAREKAKLYSACKWKFLEYFPINIFQDCYAFFYSLIVDTKQWAFNESDISNAVKRNGDLILNSPYINIDKFIYGGDENVVDSQTNEAKLYAFEKEAIELFQELNADYSLVEADIDRFDAACRSYLDAYINVLRADVPHGMSRIMSEGLRVKLPNKRSRLYKGYEDACEWFREQDSIISKLVTGGKVHEHTVADAQELEEILENDTAENDDEVTIGTGLEEIDEVVGGIRRSNMIGILGPPKGGKTRFTTHLVAQYLANGYNVVVWPLEGTESEWKSCLESNIILNDSNIYIDSKSVLFRKYDPSAQQAVNAARVKLRIGKGRGKLSFINKEAFCEDFIEVLKEHYERYNKFDVIVIDSLVLISSRRGLPKTDRISQAYEKLKVFISNGIDKKFVAIIPAQLKQDTVNWLRSHPNDTIDVTAGGESAATIRSPDYVWGLFSSKEERNNNMMKIYDVASRHNGNFGDFYARCRLGACHFWSEPDLNNTFRG